jgi:hypothetical protein
MPLQPILGTCQGSLFMSGNIFTPTCHRPIHHLNVRDPLPYLHVRDLLFFPHVRDPLPYPHVMDPFPYLHVFPVNMSKIHFPIRMSGIHFPIQMSGIDFPIHMSEIHLSTCQGSPSPPVKQEPLPLLYIRTFCKHLPFLQGLCHVHFRKSLCSNYTDFVVQSIINYQYTNSPFRIPSFPRLPFCERCREFPFYDLSR